MVSSPQTEIVYCDPLVMFNSAQRTYKFNLIKIEMRNIIDGTRHINPSSNPDLEIYLKKLRAANKAILHQLEHEFAVDTQLNFYKLTNKHKSLKTKGPVCFL